MKQPWAEELDTNLEMNGSRWDDLDRHSYLSETGGLHTRWEAEDGWEARGEGVVFVNPRTGAVSAGELAEKLAAEYHASLITAEDEPLPAVAVLGSVGVAGELVSQAELTGRVSPAALGAAVLGQTGMSVGEVR